MEKLDSKTILGVVKRLVGNIHSYGSASVDNDSYENLETMCELYYEITHMLIEESQNKDSYMGSVMVSGKKAYRELLNAFEELADVLDDDDVASVLDYLTDDETDNGNSKNSEGNEEEEPIFVNIYYSFDPEGSLYKFNSFDEAVEFIQSDWEHEANLAKENGEELRMVNIDTERGTARLQYEDGETIEWSTMYLSEH